jgi:serine/threonine protein kinase
LGNGSAQNSFGIFLERGIVFRSNQSLAAHYFELSALQGNRDGANNLGFCFEHGRGVCQNIESAAEWYRFAADHNHPEGEMNYQRCLRLLGDWHIPDRSFSIADQPRSDDLRRKFHTAVEDSVAADCAGAELVAAIRRLKNETAECPVSRTEWIDIRVAQGNSTVVFEKDCEGFTAIKTAAVPVVNESLQREIAILKRLNHPLVVHLRKSLSGAVSSNLAVMTEFVENGSLADHLPDAENGELSRLSGSTRIVGIIVGIVLAMRFLHSQNIIHRDLTPENILVDWDWTVRICDFSESISPDDQQHPLSINPNSDEPWLQVASRYLAPECYKNVSVEEGDVFSFGLILYELINGRPVFPKEMGLYKVASMVVADNWRPPIPDEDISEAAKLIRDCLSINYRLRPSFIEILHRLKAIKFKLIAGVNSEKIAKFVETIENDEIF